MNRVIGTILIPAFALFAMCVRAADVQWNDGAGDNDWNNPTNWAGNALPTSADNPKINLAGPDHSVFHAGSSGYNLIRVGDSGASGELLVTVGGLSSSSTTVTDIGVGGRTGTVTVTNGSISFGGYMEVGLNSGSIGNLNISGGLLDSARNGTIGGVPNVSIGFGDGAGARGNCVVSGGELRTRTGILLGANSGTGRFEVRGGGVANIGTDNAADDGFWVQNSGSTLAAYVTNGTLGSIYVANLSGAAGTYSDGNVIFMPGSLLEVGFLGAPSPGAWDLMRWDGTSWTMINSVSVTMNSTLLVGFAVCSRNNGFLDTAVFDNVSVSGIWPPLPGTPSGLIASSGDTQATINWSAATNATGYNLKRANSSEGPYATVAGNLGNLFFTDTGLTNGVLYFYSVSGTNIFGESTNSNFINVRPISLTPPLLTYRLAGSQLQFSWPSTHVGWQLQTQTNSPGAGLGTNWVPIMGSTATDVFSISIDAGVGSVFYRLVHP